MVPLGVYKFELYEGDTFLRKMTFWSPLRAHHRGENYREQSEHASLLRGMIQVFGKVPNGLYDGNSPIPQAIYPAIPVKTVLEFPESAGFPWNEYVGRTIDMYLDKEADMRIRVTATITEDTHRSGMSLSLSYIRNGRTWFTYTAGRSLQEYTNNLGSFEYVFRFPLPDFEQLNIESSNNCLCCISMNGAARYTTISTSPSATPVDAYVGSYGVYEARNNVLGWLGDYHPDYPDDDNPFWEDDEPDEGGGDDQNFDEDTDDVDEDEMPDLSAIGTGFATLFTPTRSQLRDLADIMWGSAWWQALQNMVEGIDKMFVSLGIMPFVVSPGATVEVTWLGLAVTEVLLTLAASQYYEFDLGSIDLSNDSRIWTSDSAMDYSPFCKLGIYLPFIGFQEINIDECRGKVIHLKYRIDALSGSCLAIVKVGGNAIYQFTGNCMVQIPITSQSFDEFISTVTNVAIAGANAKTASAIAGGGDKAAESALRHAESGLASATANAISGLKPSYNKSGAVSASNALFAVKQPYLFLTSPRVCVPEHYQRYSGFPANITDILGNFEGFTVVESIRLNNLVATSPEVDEIYQLLHEGVII